MPELPEVEVVKEGLIPLLTQRTITRIRIATPVLRVPVPKRDLMKWVKGAVVTAVRRRAKFLVVEIANGALLIIHLGMTGKLGLFPVRSRAASHDHLHFTLDNNMVLRYNDTRRFGSVQLLPPGSDQEAFFASLGPEPLGKSFKAGYLMEKSRGLKRPIKNFLMDGRVVVGIGNIYANEILFHCGILPDTPVAKLNKGQWQTIVVGTREILQRAIAAGGSTIADFVGSSGEKGYFQLELAVYGRKGQSCKKCSQPIVKIRQAGRATFFCPQCQK